MVDRADVYPRWDSDVDDKEVDNIIKALLGEFGGGWKWKPADWVQEGILAVRKVKSEKPLKSEKSHGKRSLADEDDDFSAISAKRARTVSSAEATGDGWKGLEAKLEELFKDLTKKHFEETRRTQEKIQLLTTQVAVLGRIVNKLSHPAVQDSVNSKADSEKSSEEPAKSNEEPAKSGEEHQKSNDPSEKSNDGEGKTAQPGAPVSTVHSPPTSKTCSKRVEQIYVRRSSRLFLKTKK